MNRTDPRQTGDAAPRRPAQNPYSNAEPRPRGAAQRSPDFQRAQTGAAQQTRPQGQNRPLRQVSPQRQVPPQAQTRPQTQVPPQAENRAQASAPADSTRSAASAAPQNAASAQKTTASAAQPKQPSAEKAAEKTAAAADTAAKKKEKEQENIETVIRLRGGVDRPFLVLVIILVCIGSAMVFSASYAYADYHFGDSLYFIRSQLRWAAIGFVVMTVVMNIDYRVYQKFTMPAFLFTLLCMGLVAIPGIGIVKNGARRWLGYGSFSFQPSELMKLALIMVLALYASANRAQMNDFRHGILYPYSIIGLVCFVTALEKHLSATMILLLIGTLIVFIGGAPVKWLAIFAATGGGLVGLAMLFFKYARQRLQYWIHPELDPGSAGYQLLQSLYAIGSGGFLGTGLGNSRQKYLYLPESQNDFIFAVICEEFGYVGALTVMALFALLVWRGVVIASSAPDTYSSLMVLGITAQIALQCIMNMAVVTGTMPVTGVSLPFFSYGGSSLIMLMFQMGMILSVSRYSYQQKS